MFCVEQAVQLHRNQQRITDAGARLVVIGNGASNFIAGFRQRTGYDGALYTDPQRNLYSALNLRRSVASSVGLRSMTKAIGTLRRGFRQTKTQGDPWQQGGVFVVNQDGTVLFHHRSEYAGDHPNIADILNALKPEQVAAAN